jgi:hypothetical protein
MIAILIRKYTRYINAIFIYISPPYFSPHSTCLSHVDASVQVSWTNICIYFPQACKIPHIAHSHWLCLSINIWRRIQIMRHLIMQFGLVEFYLPVLWSKYVFRSLLPDSRKPLSCFNVRDKVANLSNTIGKLFFCVYVVQPKSSRNLNAAA